MGERQTSFIDDNNVVEVKIKIDTEKFENLDPELKEAVTKLVGGLVLMCNYLVNNQHGLRKAGESLTSTLDAITQAHQSMLKDFGLIIDYGNQQPDHSN